MPITEAQRERRKQHIGASDVPAILGLSEYKTIEDLRLEKRGEIEDKQTSEAADIGNMLEEALVEWAGSELGMKLKKNQSRVWDKWSVLSANHDALAIDRPIGIEAKTHGIMGHARDMWGAESTDEVPDKVSAQCQAQMLVSDLREVYVPALIGGRGRAMFCVKRDEEICRYIEEQCRAFWKAVEENIPIVGASVSLEYSRRRVRVEGKAVELDRAAVERWQQAKEVEKEAKSQAEQAQARVYELLGDAEIGNVPGFGRLEIRKISSNRVDVDLVKRLVSADLLERCVVKSESKRMNWKGEK